MDGGLGEQDVLSMPEFWAASLPDQINLCHMWLQRNSSNGDPQKVAAVQNQLNLLQSLAARLQTVLEESAEKDQKLQTVLEESAEKDQKLESLAATLQTERQENQAIREWKEATSLASIKKRYPVLCDRTDSSTHVSQTHKSAKVEEFADDVFVRYGTAIAQVAGVAAFWTAGLWAVPQEAVVNCDSESDAVGRVKQMVTSVLHGLELNTIVEVVQNRTVAGVECDLLLVYKHSRLPFSCIEVKKPGNTPKGRNAVFGDKGAGQLYDECKAVELFGFDSHGGVVGMISTGNHWRMVCTQSVQPTAEDLLNAWQTLKSKSQQGGEDQGSSSMAESQGVSLSPEQCKVTWAGYKKESKTEVGDDKRKVFVSQVIPALEKKDDNVADSGEIIAKSVAGFVLRACWTLVTLLNSTQRGIIRPKMPCRHLKKDEQGFSFGTVRMKYLGKQYIPHDLKNLFIIYPIGHGETGDCCLGVTKSGACRCAVKFYRNMANARNLAEEELGNWNKVYGEEKEVPKCLIWSIAGEQACLIMPYVRSVDIGKRHGLLDNGTIRATLEQFAKSKCIHGDVKWRHFGWLDFGRNSRKLIMIDLGSIKPATDKEIKLWVQESLTLLESRAGTPQESTPLRKRNKPE